MVSLVTQPPEINTSTPASIGYTPSASIDLRQLGNVAGEIMQSAKDDKKAASLSAFLDELLNLDAVDQKLEAEGEPPLSADEASSLQEASTAARKMKTLQGQRARGRAGDLHRISTLKAFNASNPRLTEEYLQIFGSAIGRPGDIISNLEEDPLSLEIAEADPRAQYIQGVRDDYISYGGNPDDSFDVQLKRVTERRELLSRKEVANSNWAIADSLDKTDALETANNYFRNNVPLVLDAALKGYAQLQIPEGREARAALANELIADFAEFKLQQERIVGPTVAASPSFGLVMDTFKNLLNTNIDRVMGKTTTEAGQNIVAKLQQDVAHAEGLAQLNFLHQTVVAGGVPMSGAEVQVVNNLAKGLDLEMVLTAGPLAPLWNGLRQSIAATGLKGQLYSEAVAAKLTPAEKAKAFEHLAGVLKASARDMSGYGPKEAANLAVAWFEDLAHVDPADVDIEVKEEILDIIADKEIMEFIGQNEDLMNYVYDDMLSYAEEVRTKIAKDFSAKGKLFGPVLELKAVDIRAVDLGAGRVNIAITPKTPADRAEAARIQRTHGTRIKQLVKSWMIYNGGTAEQALDALLKVDTPFYEAPREEQTSADSPE